MNTASIVISTASEDNMFCTAIYTTESYNERTAILARQYEISEIKYELMTSES